MQSLRWLLRDYNPIPSPAMPRASRPLLAMLLTAAGPSLLLLAACSGGTTADRAKAAAATVAAVHVQASAAQS